MTTLYFAQRVPRIGLPALIASRKSQFSINKSSFDLYQYETFNGSVATYLGIGNIPFYGGANQPTTINNYKFPASSGLSITEKIR